MTITMGIAHIHADMTPIYFGNYFSVPTLADWRLEGGSYGIGFHHWSMQSNLDSMRILQTAAVR